MGHPRLAAERSGVLHLADGQQLAWDEWGNPEGIPVLFLHGGPGGTRGRRGFTQRFDPARYRIISLDQRGCGQSIPLAGTPDHDLSRNTTAQLIDDLEVLREHLERDGHGGEAMAVLWDRAADQLADQLS